MSASINMDPALVALAQLGRPPAQLVAGGNGDIATTRGDLGRVTVGYRPLEGERFDRGLFEATTARIYGVSGGRLTQVLASPELESLWRTWREGAFAEFPASVTVVAPDGAGKPRQRERGALAALTPPSAPATRARPARP